MFIDTIPNRKSPPAVLLRESYREGGRVKKRTLANLSKLPRALIDGIGALPDGGKVSGKRGRTRLRDCSQFAARPCGRGEGHDWQARARTNVARPLWRRQARAQSD